MAVLSPLPSLQDLNLTFHQTTLVFPSKETEKRSIFLSNSDHFFNENVRTAHFFKANPDYSPENVAARLKNALEKVLVPYDFIAGRLKMNHKVGRLELDCNVAGAGFVVASTDASLDEIGDFIVHPNLGFRQLAVQKIDGLAGEVEQPIFVVQLTSFKCGGFAIGMSMNHILFDGMGAKLFVENLASQAFDDDKPLAVIPCKDRSLLAARSPPVVAFPHREFLDLNDLHASTPPPSNGNQTRLEYKIFKLSAAQILQLKSRAKNSDNPAARISSFAVMAALVWQCKAFSDNKDRAKDKVSTLVHIINIRERVDPPLPMSYSANAVLPMGVSATHDELENGPFGKLVEMITEGAKEMTDEYAKSAIDWLEGRRGVPHGDYIVISWMRLGFDRVEYPWGKAMYSCPLVYERREISLIFPDAMDGGVGAMVALPAEQMERFEARFRKFFE
ncbi:acyltransferase GLAUCE-like [Andrographis paniculata]|uniref:acyltransferase GLAUCE-like n=1 Tax=Andrographis paniculata TaxID=175694 RepID=UPI0021E85298|nr:acyltransferase GLAUCE-like [Andrographis paniculata]